jgi:hypothetical protein
VTSTRNWRRRVLVGLVCYWRPIDDLPSPGPAPKPPITDHAFEPWTSDRGWSACIHLQDGRVCGAPEAEHAPAPEQAEA